MTRDYGVLYDDPAMANDPKKIPLYLRAKRSWFVIDKEGIIRYVNISADPKVINVNDEILAVLNTLK